MKPTLSGPAAVIIADNHQLVRAGLKATLKTDSAFQVVAEAETSAQVLSLVQELRPPLLILDPELKDGNHADYLLQDCRLASRDTRILILSGHFEAQYWSPLKDLIDGFVLKTEALDCLLQALRVILAGEQWFSQEIRQSLLELSELERTVPQVNLTRRERQILDLMCQGKNNAAISEELSISKQTVRRYATIIYEKLGVRSRVQAVLHPAAQGLVGIGGDIPSVG